MIIIKSNYYYIITPFVIHFLQKSDKIVVIPDLNVYAVSSLTDYEINKLTSIYLCNIIK